MAALAPEVSRGCPCWSTPMPNALVRRTTKRLPLAVGACGPPVQAATLRVYAIDYALVRRCARTSPPTPAATPGPGGDPAGLHLRLRSRASHDALAPSPPAPAA